MSRWAAFTDEELNTLEYRFNNWGDPYSIDPVERLDKDEALLLAEIWEEQKGRKQAERDSLVRAGILPA